MRLPTLLFRVTAGCCATYRLCGVQRAFWNRNERWIDAVLLCDASLNGTHRCNRLACPCGVLFGSGIGFRALLLCSLVSKRVFKVFWTQVRKNALCLQTLSRKDGEALQKFSKFDTGVSILCRFIVNCVLSCLTRNAGCLFT